MTKGTILVVDDAMMICTIMRHRLTAAGYDVHAAACGAEAMELLTQHPEIALVVLDYHLPDVGCRELVAWMRACNPELPIVICTGCLLCPEEAEVFTEFELPVITKPFGRADLLHTVERTLAESRRASGAAV